jgi:hypothetical protein
MKVSSLTTYLYLVLLYSCSDREESGHKVVYEYDTNKRVTKQYFINEQKKKDGLYKEFYLNGKLKFLFNYSNDSLNGEQKAYYETGTLNTLGYYRNNQIDSIQKWFYPNGKIKNETFRLDGRLFGIQKEFFPNGNTKDLYFMKNDTDMVFSLEFNQEGNLISNVKRFTYCIYEKSAMTIKDSAKLIFYTVVPPSYSYRCQIIERKNGITVVRKNCFLEEINNNMAYLLVKSFKEPGNYEFGFSVTLENKFLNAYITDSVFLPIRVYQ